MARTWLITGASRGLGRAFAEAALGAGDAVIVAAACPAFEDMVAAHPGRAFAFELDVTDRAGVFAVVDEAAELLGRLDVVVNCAGYGLHAPIEETTEHEARAQMETNFFGALWVAQAAMPPLRRAGAGHLIQMSSAAGGVAFPSSASTAPASTHSRASPSASRSRRRRSASSDDRPAQRLPDGIP